jgi:hypothetical protein
MTGERSCLGGETRSTYRNLVGMLKNGHLEAEGDERIIKCI